MTWWDEDGWDLGGWEVCVREGKGVLPSAAFYYRLLRTVRSRGKMVWMDGDLTGRIRIIKMYVRTCNN
jgi:hypothetical protein